MDGELHEETASHDAGSLDGAHLAVFRGSNAGDRHELNGTSQVIGRRGFAEVELDDDLVSERHAKILVRNGRHVIYDLYSASGLFVNNKRVAKAELKDGDVIRLGETFIQYECEHAREPRWNEDTGGTSVPPLLRDDARRMLDSARGNEDVVVALVPHPMNRRMQVPGMVVPEIPPRGYTIHRDEDEELTIVDVIKQIQGTIRFFKPYWRVVTALTLLGVIVGVASYYFRPPSRTAMFEVSLVENAAENPVNRFERRNVAFFRSAEQNFRSLTLIEKTLAELGEDKPSEERLAAVQRRLELRTVGTHSENTYRGTYSSPSETESLRFLETHTRLYLDTEIDKTLKVIRVEAEFLEEQLAETEKELLRTEEALLAFKKENIDGLPEQARQYYSLLFELERQQSEVGTALSRIRAQVDLDRVRLAAEPQLVETRVLATRPYQSALVQINQEIARRKAAGEGEDHPEIKKLRRQAEEYRSLARNIQSGDTEIERSRNPNHETIKTSLHQLEISEQVARKEAGRISRDLAKVKRVVDRLPELEAQYAELTRSYDATKELHTRIFQQLKTAKLQLELERASAAARYDLITPPRLEYVSPGRKILGRAAPMGFGGFLLGACFAAIGHARRRTREEEVVG